MTPGVGEEGKVRPEQAPFIEQMLFQRFYDDGFARAGADGRRRALPHKSQPGRLKDRES
jgi:hypothetical protein